LLRLARQLNRGKLNATFGAYSTVKLLFPTAELNIDHDWAFKHYTFDWTLDPKAGGVQIRDLGNGLYIYHQGDDGSWKIATTSGTVASLSRKATKT